MVGIEFAEPERVHSQSLRHDVHLSFHGKGPLGITIPPEGPSIGVVGVDDLPLIMHVGHPVKGHRILTEDRGHPEPHTGIRSVVDDDFGIHTQQPAFFGYRGLEGQMGRVANSRANKFFIPVMDDFYRSLTLHG